MHEFGFADTRRRGYAHIPEIMKIARVADFACRQMSPAEIDLLTIAGCVYYADRVARRRRVEGWSRDIHLKIAVHDTVLWSKPAVHDALQDCLQFVTGDRWQFDFLRVRANHPSLSERFLPSCVPVNGTPFVVSYSGGLDSYAGLRLLQRMRADWHPYLVRARTRSLDGKAIQDLKLPSSAQVPLLVDVRLPESDRDREPTGRTRTFLFLSIAGVAASLLEARQIAVCENGQGSLGPSLVQGPWEFPFRATHPGFTERFALLLRLVSGKAIPVEHPFLDQTKGDVLRQFSESEMKQALAITHSCVRYPMRHKGVRPAPTCGICGGCLLRRVSLIAADHLELERAERYYWKDLSAQTVGESSTMGRTTDRDHRIATRAALDMADLAALSSRDGDAVSVRRVASEYSAARGLRLEESHERLQALIRRHNEDWTKFVSTLGRGSWIRALIGAQHNA